MVKTDHKGVEISEFISEVEAVDISAADFDVSLKGGFVAVSNEGASGIIRYIPLHNMEDVSPPVLEKAVIAGEEYAIRPGRIIKNGTTATAIYICK